MVKRDQTKNYKTVWVIVTNIILLIFLVLFSCEGNESSEVKNKTECKSEDCDKTMKRGLGSEKSEFVPDDTTAKLSDEKSLNDENGESNYYDITDENDENCAANLFDGCISDSECCSGFCNKDQNLKSGICEPSCGRSDFNLLQSGVSQARKAKYGEFPWHVAIYERQSRYNSFEIICGGTLISRKVVISVAHCVTIPNDKTSNSRRPKPKKIANLIVAAGKYYSTLNAVQDDLAQILEVEKIKFPLLYLGHSTQFSEDFAVIVLKTEVKFSLAVRPICIDLSENTFEDDQLERGVMGKVVGWGWTRKKEASETLKIIDLQYIPTEECVNTITHKMLSYVRSDKICARRLEEFKNVTVCNGDSGGGLIVEDPVSKAYYLRGILSVGDSASNCEGGNYVLFTKLSSHKELVKEHLQDCERFSYLRECGRAVSQLVMSRVRPAELKEFPWHVGIYQYNTTSDSYDHICAGSIISRKVVLSAAHCFVRPEKGDGDEKLTDPSQLLIAVGKNYRNFDVPKDDLTQIIEVQTIKISSEYLGSTAFYANDIAVLILKTNLKYNNAVRPVCLDIDEDNFENDHLQKEKVGEVAGWEINMKQGPKETLKVAEMPFVPRHECKSKIHFTYEPYVSNDKICAGDKSSNVTLCSADGGAGLIFEDPETEQFYLRGIVSLGPQECYEGGFALFTKLSSHEGFVGKYIEECHENCKRKKCDPLISKKLKIICYTPDGQETRCDKPFATNSKASFDCKEPIFTKVRIPEYNTTQCKNGRWDRPLIDDFCSAVCGKAKLQFPQPLKRKKRIANGKLIGYGDFPWHAGLYEYNLKSHIHDPICGGTLISQKVVITAATCVVEESNRKVILKEFSTLRVAVGKLYRIFDSPKDVSAQILEVEKIEIPPQFLSEIGLYDNDIAFILLKKKVEYNALVQPICLDIGEDSFEDKQLKKGAIGKIAGWGLTTEQEPSEVLLMAEMPFVPKDECINKITKYLRLYATREKLICAGNKTSRMSVCPGDSGEGLVFQDLDTKIYYLRGITSLGPKGCKGGDYALFTKLSSYKALVEKYLQL